jgi:5,5'-dehydrodivanillate O-demethylase
MPIPGALQFADLEAVGPGTPAGRYLRRFWQPVQRASDLRPKQAKPIEVMGERFTLYRGEDGTPHVVAFRCAHRGTQLSLGWVEGDELRCRYHGWKFDGSGQCTEQPNEDKPFCQRVKIGTYPTREYAGLIFAYFGDGAAPEFPRYPDFDQEGVIVVDPIEILPCSFWNKMDNDPVHIPWVHRATALRKGRMDFLTRHQEGVEEAPYGVKTNRSMADRDDSALGVGAFNRFFMPNIRQFWPRSRAKGFENRKLWDTKMVWTVPINDGKFASFDVTHTPLAGEEARAYARARKEQQEAEAETRWDLAEKVLAGEMTLDDLPADMGAYTSFAIEDYCTQVAQGSIAGRGRETLASTDAKPMMIRRLWLREVTAMLEGRPLTQWQIPAEPRNVLVRT